MVIIRVGLIINVHYGHWVMLFQMMKSTCWNSYCDNTVVLMRIKWHVGWAWAPWSQPILLSGPVDLTLSHWPTQTRGSINCLWRVVMDLHFGSLGNIFHLSKYWPLRPNILQVPAASSVDYPYDPAWLSPYSQIDCVFFFVFFFRHHSFTLRMSLFFPLFLF